jgi:glycosyltransferase involved in cell wall biosynthesis
MVMEKNLVSIGLPVYNGEKFLGQALEALLAQDYGHFEIIISDNASTDATQEICREYMARDRRIQYHRNDENKGARYNFRKVLGLAAGPYFLWAADHDLWHPSLISRCVEIMEADRGVVLCYPRALRIDAHNNALGLATNQIDTRNLPAAERYLRIIRDLSGGDPIYGVMRTAAMQKVDVTTLWAGDQARLAALSLAGAFAHIPEPLFYWRQIRDESLEFRRKTVPLAVDPVGGQRLLGKDLPELWREFGEECLAQVGASDLSEADKERLAQETKTIFTRRYGVKWPAGVTTVEVKQSPKPAKAPVLLAPAASQPSSASPLVSVIVCTQNHPDMLVTALQSVLSQTCRHHEIIVVNDGGPGANSMAGWLNQQGDITYVRHDRPRGLAAARNTGIKISRGQYLAYLNDDEILYPDHLESLVTFLEASDFEVAYTDAVRAWQEKKLGRYEVTKREPCPAGDYDPDDLLVGNVAPAVCMMHARACLTVAGAFDETFTALADWDLWIRLSRQYAFARLKQITCEFSRRPEDSALAGGNPQDLVRATEMIYAKYREEGRDKPEIETRRQDYLEKLRKSLVAGKPSQATQLAGTEARPTFGFLHNDVSN